MKFAERMGGVHRSYIREILKVTARPEVISFAGGLPNPVTFPVEDVAKAADAVFREEGADALQYSTTEGYLPLREFIAARYRKGGLDVSADEILITTGSQQGLDLVAKTMIDRGAGVVIERPGYLGAIQSFSVFGARFLPVDMTEQGVDTQKLEKVLKEKNPSLFYAVPSFQNPSGITYTEETRREVARLMKKYGCLFVEDNPYGELRFMGEHVPPVKYYMDGEPSVLFGSFSKVASPGMRIGWVCAPGELMSKLITAKQASDLHTSTLNQRMLYKYLEMFDVDAHIETIRQLYKGQRDLMVECIREHFPAEISTTEPEGGMFLWCTLPEGMSSEDLFQKAIARNVAFVPGKPFYVDGTDNTFRLNYSNASKDMIREGIKRLGESLHEFLGK